MCAPPSPTAFPSFASQSKTDRTCTVRIKTTESFSLPSITVEYRMYAQLLRFLSKRLQSGGAGCY